MILGYARVSTIEQANDDRSSLQTQTDIIEGFAHARGVDRFGVQIYVDAGVSGATKLRSRPAGSDMLAAMQPGDLVIASKLDRMFRSSADALAMMEEFREKGVALYLFDMGNDPVTEGGMSRFLFTILAAVADMERVRIKERVMEGKKAKKVRGGAIGNVPWGYRKVGDGRSSTLEINPEESELTARMRGMFRQGIGFTAIARALTAEGIRTRTGMPYSAPGVRHILQEQMQ